MTKKHTFPIRYDILVIPYIVSLFVVSIPLMLIFGAKKGLELYGVYILAQAVFQSRTWKLIARQSWLNLIPTLVIGPVFAVSGVIVLLLAWLSCILFKSKKQLQLNVLITLSTMLYLMGIRAIVRARSFKEMQSAEPAIHASNHAGYPDNFFVGARMAGLYWTIMVKDLMMKIPPFSFYLAEGRGIQIERDPKTNTPTHESRQKALADADKRIKQRVSLAMFPEGTRLKKKGVYIGTFKKGMTVLSWNNKMPVITFMIVWSKLFESSLEKPLLFTGTIYAEENYTFYPADYTSHEEMQADIAATFQREIKDKLWKYYRVRF